MGRNQCYKLQKIKLVIFATAILKVVSKRVFYYTKQQNIRPVYIESNGRQQNKSVFGMVEKAVGKGEYYYYYQHLLLFPSSLAVKSKT